MEGEEEIEKISLANTCDMMEAFKPLVDFPLRTTLTKTSPNCLEDGRDSDKLLRDAVNTAIFKWPLQDDPTNNAWPHAQLLSRNGEKQMESLPYQVTDEANTSTTAVLLTNTAPEAREENLNSNSCQYNVASTVINESDIVLRDDLLSWDYNGSDAIHASAYVSILTCPPLGFDHKALDLKQKVATRTPTRRRLQFFEDLGEGPGKDDDGREEHKGEPITILHPLAWGTKQKNRGVGVNHLNLIQIMGRTAHTWQPYICHDAYNATTQIMRYFVLRCVAFLLVPLSLTH